MKSHNKAFTLAEVLITLGIIGFIVVLIIPTLMQNYKDRVWATSATVFERKLEEALKSMNNKQTLAGYSNTLDFVNELNKHLKITKICKNDDLMSCFEDKVIWGNEEVDMTKVKNASHFGQDNWDTNIIGVQFAIGTTGLIAYNPNCEQNPFSNKLDVTSCLAILYDTSGFKAPNTQQKDLRSLNILSLGGRNCAIELPDGTCFGALFYPEALTKAECEQLKGDLGIYICYYDNDYWAGAVKACGGVSKMPSRTQLDQLAEALYQDPGRYISGNRNNNLAISMGLASSAVESFDIWTSGEYGGTTSNGRYFGPDDTFNYYFERNYSYLQAVCIDD